MSSSKATVDVNGGLGFCSLLTVLFIGLKLSSFIEWSWLWILSPLWLPWVVILGGVAFVAAIIAIGAGVGAVVGWVVGKLKGKKNAE